MNDTESKNGSQNGATATASANGAPQGFSEGRVQDILTGQPLTTGYVPTPFIDQFWGMDGVPYWWLRRDIPMMLSHPHVRNSLNYFKSGIAGAEFWGGADPENADNTKGLEISKDPRVSAFVLEQCQRFWDRGVHALQRGYDYGWVGCENEFTEDEGQLKWDGVKQFAPRDTFILTQGHIPVGIRVRNVHDQGGGQVDLWLASGDVPAKGLWYAHDPVDGMLYGQSQLFGAWRPWKRLAAKDAAETVVDGGVYRLAYAGPIVRYPEEDYQAQLGTPGTTLDSQGRPRRYARDMARMMAEQFKTGAAVGLPSSQYPKESGGGNKWDITFPSNVLNVAPLIEYLKVLQDQISYGIGVPPELLQAAETGSGYSGRAIPMESFISGQQKIADIMLNLFINQILKTLVRWNFGDVKFTVKVKDLLKTRTKATQDGQQMEGKQQIAQTPNDQEPKQVTQGAFSINPILITDRVRQIAARVLHMCH